MYVRTYVLLVVSGSNFTILEIRVVQSFLGFNPKVNLGASIYVKLKLRSLKST